MDRHKPPDYLLGPALDFLAHIWALNHAIERVSTRTQRALRISAPQRLVLRCIGKFPGIASAGHAARLLQRPPGRLLGGPTPPRRPSCWNATVGGGFLLGLTAKGRALDRPMPHTVEHAVERLLTLTDPADLEAAARTLTKLAALLLAELSESPQRRGAAAASSRAAGQARADSGGGTTDSRNPSRKPAGHTRVAVHPISTSTLSG